MIEKLAQSNGAQMGHHVQSYIRLGACHTRDSLKTPTALARSLLVILSDTNAAPKPEASTKRISPPTNFLSVKTFSIIASVGNWLGSTVGRLNFSSKDTTLEHSPSGNPAFCVESHRAARIPNLIASPWSIVPYPATASLPCALGCPKFNSARSPQ